MEKGRGRKLKGMGSLRKVKQSRRFEFGVFAWVNWGKGYITVLEVVLMEVKMVILG